ncbi:MAG: hypothetical protein HN390_06275 [Anaerolineae bacterium]|jgi:hypothetical protein|nr:hypothetical protein [Anaerolineae bacterium]MBT7191511.1 hypothetical protein [Anaerolineae bacterium]MBT7989550.1 hypothetical protein [Anaerolineae bacterium]
MEKPKSTLGHGKDDNKALTSMLFGILALVLVISPILLRYKISMDFVVGSVLLAILSSVIGRLIGKPELKRLRIREKAILLRVKPEEEAIALDNLERRKIMAIIGVAIGNLFILAIILYILYFIWFFATGSWAS